MSEEMISVELNMFDPASSSHTAEIEEEEAETTPPPASDPPSDDEKVANILRRIYDAIFTFLSSVYKAYMHKKSVNRMRENLEIPNDTLPVNSNGSRNADEEGLSWKDFLRSALDIRPYQRFTILILQFTFLRYLIEPFIISTLPFEFQFVITPNTPPPLHVILTFHQAIHAFSPEIAFITLCLICYIFTWILVIPLHPQLLILLVPFLIYLPFLLFPYLLRKASASGIYVHFRGSFKLPLIAFTALGTLGFFLLFLLLVFLALYLISKCVHGRRPARDPDIERNSENLTSIISTDSNATDNVRRLVLSFF